MFWKKIWAEKRMDVEQLQNLDLFAEFTDLCIPLFIFKCQSSGEKIGPAIKATADRLRCLAHYDVPSEGIKKAVEKHILVWQKSAEGVEPANDGHSAEEIAKYTAPNTRGTICSYIFSEPHFSLSKTSFFL